LANDFEKCINEALAEKRIKKDVADAILESDDPNATIDELLSGYTRTKRETAIQAVRVAEAYDNVFNHPAGPHDGIMALLTKDPTGRAPYKNVEYLAEYYKRRFNSQNAEFLSKYRSRMFGLSEDVEGQTLVLKAMMGEEVADDAIKGMAKAIADTLEEMRVTFNARGGSIAKNQRFVVPQRHDQSAVAKADPEEWKNFIRNLLDRDYMTNNFGKKLDDKEFEEALDVVYETIATGGLNKQKGLPTSTFGKKLSRRHGERRFLYFKDAESWMKYMNRFGRGSIFDAVTDHIDMMSNDIAVMELLGPNPETTFRYLQQEGKKAKKITGREEALENATYKNATGQVNQGELTTLADGIEATRNILTSVTLGGATLSAVSDVGFQAITSRLNGISALKVINRQLSLLNPANEQDRMFGTRIGLVAEMASRQTSANRYADAYGTGKTARLAEGILRASGLEAWTNAARKAFGMEFSALLADNFGKPLDALDGPLQRAFQRYGITEADWNSFRKQKPLVLRGELKETKSGWRATGPVFADMTVDDGVKFHQMVMSETDFAVPTPDSRVRAVTNMGLGRAQVSGIGIRAIMQLKSFPITVLMTHGMRGFWMDTTGQKVQYFGALLATTTMLGAVAMNAKDIAAGRNPRPINEDGSLIPNGQYITAAMLQGGGAGIVGDFLFSDQNRFGSGPLASAFGPTGQLVDRAWKLSVGNVQQAIAGEETNLLPESIDFVERYSPDIWQIQVIKNAMFDQLELLADPTVQKKYNRVMRQRYQDYNGQTYWYEQGELLPEALQ